MKIYDLMIWRYNTKFTTSFFWESCIVASTETLKCVFGSLPFHLKVLRVHLVPQCVGPAHRPQRRGHRVWVVDVLHQRVDGSHDSISVLSELDTSLHLLRLLDVLEVLEKLLGWGEIYKQPAKKERKKTYLYKRDNRIQLLGGSRDLHRENAGVHFCWCININTDAGVLRSFSQRPGLLKTVSNISV